MGSVADVKNMRSTSLVSVPVRGTSINSRERVQNVNIGSNINIKGGSTNVLENLKINGSGTAGINKEMPSLLKSPMKTA